MWRKTVIMAVMALAVIACKHDTGVELRPSGTLSYKGQTCSVRTFRLAVDTVIGGMYIADIQFATSSLDIRDGRISGDGHLISLRTHLPAPALDHKAYIVDAPSDAIIADSSSVTTYPKDAGDTISAGIIGGELALTGSALGYSAAFRFLTAGGDSITGSYDGPLVHSIDVDLDSVGSITVDTLHTALRHSRMWAWGTLFGKELYYYELELLSSDFRYRDDGSPRSGLMFTIGLHSADPERPSAGAYPVAESARDMTAFYGHKEKNTPWGTYWQLFENSSARRRANVIADTVWISWADDTTCILDFSLKDQLNNRITGTYLSPVEIMDAYTGAEQ